jgi:hypothetical protein
MGADEIGEVDPMNGMKKGVLFALVLARRWRRTICFPSAFFPMIRSCTWSNPSSWSSRGTGWMAPSWT